MDVRGLTSCLLLGLMTANVASATCIMVTPSAQCVATAEGDYDLALTVQNDAAFTLEYAFILGDPILPPGVGFALSPQEALGLAPGETATLNARVTGVQPGQQVDFFVALHDQTLGQCCVVPLSVTFPNCSDPSLVRGDCNADGLFNIADPIFFLGYLFSMGTTPGCLDSCDSNDDGQTNIADAIRSLSALFGGGASPPAPFPSCGPDPTVDSLSCLAFPPCP